MTPFTSIYYFSAIIVVVHFRVCNVRSLNRARRSDRSSSTRAQTPGRSEDMSGATIRSTEDTTIRKDKAQTAPQSETASVAARSARIASPEPVAKTVKGQRHVSPVGRHSQQTHKRARQRAAAEGFTTEKEQHDGDRQLVEARLAKRADQVKQQQRQQATRTVSPTSKPEDAAAT